MTEQEWLAAKDAQAMCNYVRHASVSFRTRWQGWVEVKRFKISDRKWRLLDLACLRSVTRDLHWPWLTRALAQATHKADLAEAPASTAQALRQLTTDLLGGAASWQESSRPRLAESICWALTSLTMGIPGNSAFYGVLARARGNAWADIEGQAEAASAEVLAEQARQAELVRDILGNPFSPERLEPVWLTVNDGAVRHLAQTIHDGEDYDDLPILADALEDAGCTSEAILGHCRGAGLHVLGCWVVDAILSKEETHR